MARLGLLPRNRYILSAFVAQRALPGCINAQGSRGVESEAIAPMACMGAVVFAKDS